MVWKVSRECHFECTYPSLDYLARRVESPVTPVHGSGKQTLGYVMKGYVVGKSLDKGLFV